MWENIVEPDRPQMTIWRRRIACWTPKATNTLTGCEIHVAFPPQQWLHNAPQGYVICTLPVLCNLPISTLFCVTHNAHMEFR